MWKRFSLADELVWGKITRMEVDGLSDDTYKELDTTVGCPLVQGQPQTIVKEREEANGW